MLKDGTLALRLRAGRGLWRPEKESGPALEIEAFGEGRGPLMAPAPLVRVPEGTTIVAGIRNELDLPLRVHGLCEHDDEPCAPIEVPARGEREVRFRSGRAGTYAYWGETTGMPASLRLGPDSQLSGAFVVDPPGTSADAARRANDRIFVITEWTDLTREHMREVIAAEYPFLKGLSLMKKGTTLMNGLSWPDTERLTYRLGESVRWRIVNTSAEPHPLHLHGFYFDVDSLGDGLRDRSFPAGQKRRVVTQLLPVGGTIALTWTPERVGNWLFHCHFMEHVAPGRRLGKTVPKGATATDRAPATPATRTAPTPRAARVGEAKPAAAGGHGGHNGHGGHGGHDGPLAGMAGMVLGVTVVDPGGTTTAAPLEKASGAPRKLTMAMGSAPNRYGTEPAYGFVLAEGREGGTGLGAAPTADEIRAPGPTLVLRRDEPVEITLVNHLPEATAVHWHGMELESYYDGVHEFGGDGRQQTPLIAPGESFVVRFTPPRTGTFMYHTHMHDYRQLSAGLYGPMLVIDPEATHDPATDHTLVIGRDGVGPAPVLVVNGSPKPQVTWCAGTRHRLRLMNITRHDVLRVSLATADGPVTWRPLTKDGAPVPTDDATPRPADLVIAVGETYDFEYDAPASRQDLWLNLRDTDGRWLLQGVAIVK